MYQRKKNTHVCFDDSDYARYHWTNQVEFEKNAEAERIAEWFDAYYKWMPTTIHWKKMRGRTMGAFLGCDIVLYIGGDTVGTLLHEIAHKFDQKFNHHRGHGPEFQRAQNIVLRAFETYYHEMVLDAKPTIHWHAQQVLDMAEELDKDPGDMVAGYAMLENVDEEHLFSQVVEMI